jgi:hypothetical protein
MPDYQERSPTALAHGPVKSSDIERVRRQVDGSEFRAAYDDQASAARRRKRIRSREAQRSRDAQR